MNQISTFSQELGQHLSQLLRLRGEVGSLLLM